MCVLRVGRTAPAGRRGITVSFEGEADLRLVHAIEKVVGVPLSAAAGVDAGEALAGMGEVLKA